MCSKYSDKVNSHWQQAFIVYDDGTPFAYIQNYRANQAGAGWWPDEPDTTVGIDQFIGDPTFLGRGLGTQIAREFSDWLLRQQGIKRIIADPDPLISCTVSTDMTLEIRKVLSHEQEFVGDCMTGLQEYLVSLDPDGRIICPVGYGALYAADLMERVADSDGQILIAMFDKKPVGLIAGIIRETPYHEKIGSTVQREGEVLELFVADSFRNRGIAGQLMAGIEAFFRTKACDVVGVAVFAPNKGAHKLYNSLGYCDRDVYLVKALR